MATKTRTADDAYAAAHLAATEKVELLASLLADLPAPDDARTNWGHVGNLNELNAKLDEALQWLTK